MSLISICVPVYDGMKNGEFFLNRLLKSLDEQTFRDFEVVITKDGKMAENTNSAIKKSKGQWVKILYQDDYFAHKDALQVIANNLIGNWLVTGCAQDPGTHSHYPVWNDDMYRGVNTIGSPSVLTMKNDEPLLFDETLTWLLDCELYMRLYEKYGPPTIVNDINVMIGIHEGQTTHTLPDEIKLKEHEYLNQKYA